MTVSCRNLNVKFVEFVSNIVKTTPSKLGDKETNFEIWFDLKFLLNHGHIRNESQKFYTAVIISRIYYFTGD